MQCQRKVIKNEVKISKMTNMKSVSKQLKTTIREMRRKYKKGLTPHLHQNIRINKY